MPLTLYRLLLAVADRTGGLSPGGASTVDSSRASLVSCWWRATSDWFLTEGAAEGGVSEPLVGVRPLLASLEVSVASVADLSVLKLALERRRSDLMDSRLGAMVGCLVEREEMTLELY